MSRGYSKQQLVKAQSKFQLAADMLELAQEADDDETLSFVSEAVGAGGRAFEELGMSRHGSD